MKVFADLLSFLSGTPASVILLLAAAVVVLSTSWRISMAALMVQYVFVGVALTQVVRPELVLVKIVVGVLAVVILILGGRYMGDAAGLLPPPSSSQESGAGGGSLRRGVSWLGSPLGLALRLLGVLLVALAVTHLFRDYSLTVLPMAPALVAAWLWGMGILGLVLSGDSLRVAAAALTLLAGFDLAFSSLEPSVAMVGFLSAFYLVAAMGFSYLIVVRALDSRQESDERPEP